MSNANAAEIMVGTYNEERSRLLAAVGQIAVSPHTVDEMPWQWTHLERDRDYYKSNLVSNVRTWLTGACGFSENVVDSVVRHDGDFCAWYARGVAPQGYELYVKGVDLQLEREFGVTPRMANARIVDDRAAYCWELLDLDGVTQRAGLDLLPVATYDELWLLINALGERSSCITVHDAMKVLSGKIDSRFTDWRKRVKRDRQLDDAQKAMLLDIPEQIRATRLFGAHMLNGAVQAEDLARAANVLQGYQPSTSV